MSSLNYKNPLSPLRVFGTQSVSPEQFIGTHFSTEGVGGYMEVYNVSDLYYTVPPSTYGTIQYSGNTIPINFYKGSGTSFSYDTLTLNSDNLSSGRKKLGMLVYVYETDEIYQFHINNYDSLWSAATASTGTIVITDFGTTVRGSTPEGIAFISGWTGNTVEGISGATSSTAVWKKLTTGGGGGGSGITGGTYYPNTLTLDLESTGSTISIGNVTGRYISAGTYTSGTSTLDLFNSTGGTISITGITAGSGGSGGTSNFQYFISGSSPTGTINDGDRWFYTESGEEFVWITDQNSSQWVQPVSISYGVSEEFVHITGDTMTGTLYVPTIIAGDVTANTLTVTGNTTLENTSGTSFYTDYIDFNNTLTPLPTDIEGRMYWDEDNGTISLGMHGGQVVQQVGLEQYYYIKNQSGATISNGRVVRAAGTLGSSGRILGEYMIANGTIPAKYALGIATEDIINGDDGYVTEFGLVRGINTTGSLYGETWTGGTILWVSPTIPGGLTSVEPQSPNLKIEMAIVIKADANGSIFVRPNRYPYLYDVQQVNYSAGTENNYDILQWSGNSWNKTNTPFFSGLTATTISATTYQNLPGSSASNCQTTFYVTNISGCSPVNMLTEVNMLSGLTVTGITSSISFSGNSDTISGTKGTVTTSGSSITAFIDVTGSNTLGGANYVDFLRVTNNSVGTTNGTKTVRVNNTGGMEFLNSAYTAVTLTIGDNGILFLGGGGVATVSNNDATSNYLYLNSNNSQIYDDGNTHIHSRGSGQSMWINTNGGQLNLLTQSTVNGGAIGSGIAIATTTLVGYVTINTGKTYSTSAAYGYLTTGGAGTYPGGAQTVDISLYATARVWAQEIDAFSDERMKDIEGEIELDEALKLVNDLKPIKYTWKENNDKGLKVGYSAQQVSKAGFDHLISLIPKEGLEETIDEDGFVSPKDTQFSMNYDQVTPYHGVVIKYLLEEIEALKQEIKELKNKIG